MNATSVFKVNFSVCCLAGNSYMFTVRLLHLAPEGYFISHVFISLTIVLRGTGMSVHEDIMKLVLNINTVTQSVKYMSIKNHRCR
ncbi:MAG: hypothetical protein ACXWC7_18515 [Chitinophagaceae bacterium]